VYVNISLLICNVPLEENPVVESTVIVPEPVIPVLETILTASSVDAELNIFSPLAANTLSAKVATINIFSPESDV